jgi:hypothetical protein
VSEPTKKLTAAGASSAAAPRYKVPAGVPPYSEVSPEVRSSWLGLLFFSWLDPVVVKGAKTALEDEDMYALRPDVEAEHCAREFEREWAVELARAAASTAEAAAAASSADPTTSMQKIYEPSISAAMYRIFKTPFWLGAICKLAMDGLQFLQPILLEWILTFMAESKRDATSGSGAPPPAWEGYVLAVALGVNPLMSGAKSSTNARQASLCTALPRIISHVFAHSALTVPFLFLLLLSSACMAALFLPSPPPSAVSPCCRTCTSVT